ncbi:MAG: B12-binding domain-containing protein, partial [Paracoccaceae bacterium]
MGPRDLGPDERGNTEAEDGWGRRFHDFRSFTEEVAARLSSTVTPGILRYCQPDREEIDALCDALIDPDDDRFHRHIEDLRVAGVTVETLYCGYLAGAARRLGEMWDCDEVSFIEMTCATGRICRGLHGSASRSGAAIPDLRRRAFFATVPGDRHTLGAVMAAELFRQRGWDIGVGVDLPSRKIIRKVREGRYPIVGLSAGSQKTLPALAEVIRDLR